ncbi:MAG: hypothetical protein R3C28_26335 [Pirellulaceae bacterium]
MKVVLFCGGLGLRIRDSNDTPKPMVKIGYRPILWHLMKYYSHFGHTDFILCLGYKGDVIKDYFLNYSEFGSNDFVMENGGRDFTLLNSDMADWRITFVDTGINANIGQRLRQVREYLEDDETFLANYSDNLTDFPLPRLIAQLNGSDAVAAFLAVKPQQSFHVVKVNANSHVDSIDEIGNSGLLINGGFFVFRNEIFNYLHDGEDLVYQPFQPLDRRSTIDFLLSQRFLGLHGYVQGQEAFGRHARQRRSTVAGVVKTQRFLFFPACCRDQSTTL